jgi:hypothetical protein
MGGQVNIVVGHGGPVHLDKLHGEKGGLVNFLATGFDNLVPIHGQPSHHGLQEIQGGHLADLLGLNLEGFRKMGDDNSLVGIVGGGEVYLVRCPALPDDKACVLYLQC